MKKRPSRGSWKRSSKKTVRTKKWRTHAKKSRKSIRRVPRKPVSSRTGGFTTETLAFTDMGLNSGNPYQFTFDITQFPRALAIQTQFAKYRAAKVTWTYEALWNSYPAGPLVATALNATVPQMYWKMDRLGQGQFNSVADFQDAGCRPIPLTRKKVISYIPDVRGVRIDPGALASPPATTNLFYHPSPLNSYTSRQAPWVNTQNSLDLTDPAVDNTTTWYGHQAILDQLAGSGATVPALTRVVCTVQWQFKDPWVEQMSPAPAMLATRILPKPKE